jgi:RNA polymerase sigma-70 factor (ECF subfamily)
MNDEPGGHAEFPPTHWTLVAAAAAPDSDAALGRLYETYWPPLRAQALRFGVREEDAADVLQELFMALFKSGSLARAESARGRFRSYLLGALRNLLNHRRANLQTEKRGGGGRPLPLDEIDLAAPIDGSPLDERAFDADWARTLVAEALRRFETEQNATSDSRTSYAVLGAMALGDSTDTPQDVATRLGLTVPAVKSRLFRLRERFRETVREEVFRTVSTEAECEDELRYLCAVLGKVDGVPAITPT